MSFGKITGHLMAARELALKHDCTSDRQRLAVEATVWHIDILLAIVRGIYHRINLGQDDD